MDLSLSTRTEGDRTVVAVGGEIDVYTAPKLREQLIYFLEVKAHKHALAKPASAPVETAPEFAASAH